MHQLSIAAADGHYLRPFAKLTLGLAAMREKQWDLARTEFQQLTRSFPQSEIRAGAGKTGGTPRPVASNR